MEDLRASFPVWAGSEIFPASVFQTLTSSATFSWLRWRSAGMPKGTRKRPHKRLLCDDFSTFHKCQPPPTARAAKTTTHDESESSVWYDICMLLPCTAPGDQSRDWTLLVGLKLFFYDLLWGKIVCDAEFLSPKHQKHFLTFTKWCTASPNIAHTG